MTWLRGLHISQLDHAPHTGSELALSYLLLQTT